MICNPRIGQPVRIRYGKMFRAAPLQDALGTVAIRSRGKPRNHGVMIDGTLHVIPCGNLQSIATVPTTAKTEQLTFGF